MAIEGKAPVIPTRIDNAYELLRKGQRFIRSGEITVTFGPPVSPDEFTGAESLDEQYRHYHELTQRVQSSIESLGAGRADPAEAAR
jgi:1-acyl-sn-glycerol-3-phosphate acyltransferase